MNYDYLDGLDGRVYEELRGQIICESIKENEPILLLVSSKLDI